MRRVWRLWHSTGTCTTFGHSCREVRRTYNYRVQAFRVLGLRVLGFIGFRDVRA